LQLLIVLPSADPAKKDTPLEAALSKRNEFQQLRKILARCKAMAECLRDIHRGGNGSPLLTDDKAAERVRKICVSQCELWIAIEVLARS
jgi:hypothetical protein